MTMRQRLGRATIVAALAVGCGGSELPAPPPTTTSTHPPASTSTTVPAAAVPPSTLAGAVAPDDARRTLQQRGIDPDELSKDIAEQLRGRFQGQQQPR